MKRKKWSEQEEQTLLSKYSEMVAAGALSKLKTREKKFKPIADHVTAAHNGADPGAFPFRWSWRDVSVKVQNMRHQYLGVKQKIRGPNGRFNWPDGVHHWNNFLRYKHVFGDLDLDDENAVDLDSDEDSDEENEIACAARVLGVRASIARREERREIAEEEREEREERDRRRRRMEEDRREEEEMEWRERMAAMQMEHERRMMQVQAEACQAQMQVVGAVARLVCQFFGAASDGLGAGIPAMPPVLHHHHHHHPGELGESRKPDADSPSEFM